MRSSSKKLGHALKRVLYGVICVFLLMYAYRKATSETHIGNTEVIQTRDGTEDVGEDIILPGPDWGGVFLAVFIGYIIFRYGVLQKKG